MDLQSQQAKQAAEKKLLEILDTAEKAGYFMLAIYLQVQTVQTRSNN
jgi:hypothetical protein